MRVIIERFTEYGPDIRRLLSEMQDLSGIHKMIADEARELTVVYLSAIAPDRHRTANRLGATPSGVLERSASRVTAEHDASSAAVGLIGPWFARAFRAVTILPKNAKALTIPVDKEAYNATVRELEAQGYRFFRPGGQGAARRMLWAVTPGGETKPMYALAARVNQTQDRTLLPSDQAFLDAAKQGIRNYVEVVFAEELGLPA